jgi:hypothetical protein
MSDTTSPRVDKAAVTHSVDVMWSASLAEDGTLHIGACPFCDNESEFTVRVIQSGPAQTVGGESDATGRRRAVITGHDSQRLLSVVCDECGRVLLDRDNNGEREGDQL